MEGPFTLAYAVTDPARSAGARDTKLVVVSSAQFLAVEPPAGRGGQRGLLPERPVVAEREEGRYQRERQEPAELPAADQQLWGLILSASWCSVIPLGTLGAGLAVWLRRRHL